MTYSPSEKRGEHGKWTSGGGSAGGKKKPMGKKSNPKPFISKSLGKALNPPYKGTAHRVNEIGRGYMGYGGLKMTPGYAKKIAATIDSTKDKSTLVFPEHSSGMELHPDIRQGIADEYGFHKHAVVRGGQISNVTLTNPRPKKLTAKEKLSKHRLRGTGHA